MQRLLALLLLCLTKINARLINPSISRDSASPSRRGHFCQDNQHHSGKAYYKYTNKKIHGGGLSCFLHSSMVAQPTFLLKLTGATLIMGKAVLSEPLHRAVYFWLKAGPVIVHYKFTQWWLEASGASRGKRDEVYGNLHDKYAEPAYKIMVRQKGLYVKIGQVLSSRPDFLPPQYIKYFSQVQDSIPQWPVEQFRDIISCELEHELGLSYADIFESVQETALGSASIGQVHSAILCKRWGQREVAVKVMHPNSEFLFGSDFQVFRWVCRVALPGWRGLLDELEKQMMTEFDYRDEAASLREVRDNMQKSNFRSKVTVPQPLDEFCSKNMLVMEKLEGRKLLESIQDRLSTILGAESAQEYIAQRQREFFSSPGSDQRNVLKDLSVISKVRLYFLKRKASALVNLLVDVHGYQIFCNGVFNGDCHPGNCLDCGKKLGLIDFGQTRRLLKEERIALARVVALVGASEPDSRMVSRAMQDAGFSTRVKDDEAMMRYAEIFFDSDDRRVDLGFATPQLYFAKLMAKNPLVDIPDAAVFVARTSFLLRGLGTGIGDPIHTARRWKSFALAAMNE